MYANKKFVISSGSKYHLSAFFSKAKIPFMYDPLFLPASPSKKERKLVILKG